MGRSVGRFPAKPLSCAGPLGPHAVTGWVFRRLGVDVLWVLAVDTGKLPDSGKKIIPISYSRVNRVFFWYLKGVQENYIDVVSQLIT